MRDRQSDGGRRRKRAGSWLALAILPLLSGCLGAAVIPILASGPLLGRTHVKAATKVPRKPAKRSPEQKPPSSEATHTKAVAESATEKSAPASATPAAAASDDPWQRFFTYAMTHYQPKPDDKTGLESALLQQPPALDEPVRANCREQQPAVIIDMDDGAVPFAPAQVVHASPELAVGLAQLRLAGIVVLWISKLPASRAADVEQALQSSGLDPHGLDQLLLLRRPDDRKQLLRQNAADDVCVIAIAGDVRGDFDELFDYLRVPGSAAGLDPMIGHGWFMVPSLDTPSGAAAP